MNKNFSKFTLNIDQNDSIALSIAKSVEGVLKRALEPLQQEGQKVLRSSRSYSDNGLRATDYYVESKYADLARQVAEEYISAQSDARGRDVRASFSPTTSSAFSVQRSTILDPAKRAALARTVIDNGGFFNRGNDGMVEWGVDSALRATSGTGREIPLTRQIRSSISSSNAAYRGRFEGLMKTVTGNDYSFSGYTDAERAALMRGARGVQMEGDRTQLNMLRARKRYEAKQQYAAAHPDDPLVKAARRRQSKKNMAKVAGAARFARNAVAYTVTAILGSVLSVVGVLNKISDKISEIGETTRRQAMTDVRYNLPAGTVRNWEVFASKRGYGNDLMPNAVNEVAQQFSSPLFYQSGTIQKIAPWLKEGTRNLMEQSSTGGDVNALGIASGIIDDLIDASLRGKAGSKTGLSRNQAFSENTQALVQQFPELAELAQLYWNDFGTSKAASIGDWKQKDTNGNMRTMTFEQWVTQGGWGVLMSERGAPISSEAAKKGSTATYLTWADLKGTMAELVRQIFETMFGGSKFAQMAEDIRSLLTKWVEPFFPQFAAKEQSRAIEANRISSAAISKNIDWKKSEADKVAVSMGYKNAQSMVGDLSKIKSGDKKFIASLTPSQLAAFSDEENIYALAAYLNDAALMELLNAEADNVAAGKDTKIVAGTSAEQRSVDAGSVASSIVRNAATEYGTRGNSAGISGLFGKDLVRSDISKLLANTPEGEKARKAFYGDTIPDISKGIGKLKDMGMPSGGREQKKYKKLFDNTLSEILASYDVLDAMEQDTGNGFYGQQAVGMLINAVSLVQSYGDNAGMSASDISSFASKLKDKIGEKNAVIEAGGKSSLAERAKGASTLVRLQDLEPVLESLSGSIGFNLSSFGGMTGASLGVNVDEEEAANSALATTTFTFTQIVNGKTVTKQTTLLSPLKKDVTLRSEGDGYQELTNALTPQ